MPGGVNHIKIGIADTGDHILDSGIFISNLTAGNIAGLGRRDRSERRHCTDGADNADGLDQERVFRPQGRRRHRLRRRAATTSSWRASATTRSMAAAARTWSKGTKATTILDGGDGGDTAIYVGNSSDYILQRDGNGLHDRRRRRGRAQRGHRHAQQRRVRPVQERACSSLGRAAP